jgi:hypothetical protein
MQSFALQNPRKSLHDHWFSFNIANQLLQIDEIMAGANGDSQIQFVEMGVSDESQKLWGPNDSEEVGRAMLVFFDINGKRTGRFVFPTNAPAGGNLVLIATSAFAAMPGTPHAGFHHAR